MGRNARKRKDRREYQRGYAAGLENRAPSGGIQYRGSAAYQKGRAAGTAVRVTSHMAAVREAMAS